MIGNNTPRYWSYPAWWYTNCSAARRWVIAICSATFFLVISFTGEQTSSIIIISEPSARWISTVPVGEKKCLDPSWGERNSTPLSRIFANGLPFLLSPRLNTWKPPLSVRISQSQFWNLCIHPSCLTISSPGWRCRWNVLFKISLMGVSVHK